MATALQGLLPQPGDGTDFPRMAAVNVEVLDGKDVIIGAYLAPRGTAVTGASAADRVHMYLVGLSPWVGCGCDDSGGSVPALAHPRLYARPMETADLPAVRRLLAEDQGGEDVRTRAVLLPLSRPVLAANCATSSAEAAAATAAAALTEDDGAAAAAAAAAVTASLLCDVPREGLFVIMQKKKKKMKMMKEKPTGGEDGAGGDGSAGGGGGGGGESEEDDGEGRAVGLVSVRRTDLAGGSDGGCGGTIDAVPKSIALVDCLVYDEEAEADAEVRSSEVLDFMLATCLEHCRDIAATVTTTAADRAALQVQVQGRIGRAADPRDGGVEVVESALILSALGRAGFCLLAEQEEEEQEEEEEEQEEELESDADAHGGDSGGLGLGAALGVATTGMVTMRRSLL
jgi:hypothetical protein